MTESPVATTLRQALAKTFEDPSCRPPDLPGVARELQALASSEDVDVEQVVRALEKDQLLAGAVMRLVGSPLYASRGAVSSLSDAVLRLGILTVRDAVFDAALKKTITGVPQLGEVMTRIAQHGTVTAYLTQIVCRHARIHDDQAFLCGLLHDIGFFALLFAVTREKAADRPPLAELWPEIDALHEHASRVVTRAWGLPNELSLVVGAHHRQHTGGSSRVAAAVNVADFLTSRFVANVIGPTAPDGLPLPACATSELTVFDSLSVLGLDQSALDPIADDAVVIMEHVLSP